MQTPPSVNVARLIYLLVCELAGVAIVMSTRNSGLEPLPLWLGLSGGLVVAGFFILVESLIKGFSLRGFSTATFGLLVGLLCAWLLTRVGLSGLLSAMLSPDAAAPLRLAVDVTLFASLGFIGAVLALRSSQDDFAFIIPYVRFRGDTTGGQPVVLDAESIMDGHIAQLCHSGFLAGGLIVPRFVLEEIQVLANSPNSANQQRGQRALACLDEMQADRELNVTIHDARGVAADETLQGRLVQTAKLLGARLMTNDDNLAKVARLQNIKVLSVHELVEALRPRVAVGEKLRLALVRPGKDDHQAVGYLSDGTMIVVNNAAARIGSTQEVIVISTLKTSGGQLVFAFTVAKTGSDSQELGTLNITLQAGEILTITAKSSNANDVSATLAWFEDV